MLIAVIVVSLLVGVFLVGELVDSRVAGGFVGGAIGAVAAFWVVWRMFLVPLRTASLQKDYSHLLTLEDDDA